jgi:hypothetical protein
MLEQLIVRRDVETIELSNRVMIEIGVASFRSTRGYTYAAILCDELAFWRSDETSLNPDVEILRALRPGMVSIPGAVLLMASSPYSQRGELYNTYRRHFGRDDARVLVWKASTLEMNPSVDKRIIEEAYESDPVIEASTAGSDSEHHSDQWHPPDRIRAGEFGLAGHYRAGSHAQGRRLHRRANRESVGEVARGPQRA